MGITVIPGPGRLIVVDTCSIVEACDVGKACAICAVDPADAASEEDSVCKDTKAC